MVMALLALHPTVAADPSPVLVALAAAVLVRRRSLLALTPTAGINQPRLPLPYDANVCFSRFKGMLELFLIDVAKVDRGMLHMSHMLQVF
jgi:hypothetical protein